MNGTEDGTVKLKTKIKSRTRARLIYDKHSSSISEKE